MNQKIKETMQSLIETSLKKGADSCDIVLSKGNKFSLSAQKGEIDKYQVSGSQALGLRVIKDKRIGLAYTEVMTPEALEQTADSAIENAMNSSENLYESIDVENETNIHTSEYAKDSSTTDDKIKFCLRLEQEAKKKDKGVDSLPYNSLDDLSSESYYMNSKNTFSFESNNYQSCYAYPLIKEGDKNSMHGSSSMSRSLAELDWEKCIEEGVSHARNWIEAKPVETGKYDVVFSPDVFGELFGYFSAIFSGKKAMEKTNPFADKLQSLVMNKRISISDLPTYKDAFFKSYVDSEGRKQQDLELIKDGVLETFYHNSASANFYKVKPNARAARGAKSPLGVSGTTTVIAKGEKAEEEVLSGDYLKVYATQGVYSGASVVSGDFSFAISGYLYKDGKSVQPVKEVTVSGNFYEMLLNVDTLGDKLHSTSEKDLFAPYFKFKGVSVAG